MFQSVYTDLLDSADITHERPLKIGDYVSFMFPGNKGDSPRILFGQGTFQLSRITCSAKLTFHSGYHVHKQW